MSSWVQSPVMATGSCYRAHSCHNIQSGYECWLRRSFYDQQMTFELQVLEVGKHLLMTLHIWPVRSRVIRAQLPAAALLIFVPQKMLPC